MFPLIVFEGLPPVWVEVGEKDIDVEYHVYVVVGSDDCCCPDSGPCLVHRSESNPGTVVGMGESGA